MIELPDELGRKWYNRGYHGTLHHDVRARVHQGTGHVGRRPVSLHPHIPVESAKRYVDLIGAEEIMAEGQRAFDDGDYRWAAEILHKLVFAHPDNQDAKNLQADAYEQMGYQTEGPQWRGIFLTAARELREGVLPTPPFATASPDTILAMPIDILFDFAAVHVIGDKAAEVDLRIDFAFTDLDETWTMWVRRGRPQRPRAAPDTQLTVSGPKAALVGVILQPAGAQKLAHAGTVTLTGDAAVPSRLSIPDG